MNKYFKTNTITTIAPAPAYDLWAADYDSQPGNLMLDLDELIFTNLLQSIDLKNKIVYDMGCGTGRHWKQLLDKYPAQLTGFDVSEGMLSKLMTKFPSASLELIVEGNKLNADSASCDVLLSTLTIAHIKNLEDVLNEWCRVLKPSAHIIITDFHPDALVKGAQRTFRHDNKTMKVTNYVHPLSLIKKCLLANGFKMVTEQTRCVDEEVKQYYVEQKAMPVYERFYGIPIIYGLHLSR